MICIARTFGAPTSVPAGNAAANRSNASLPGRELAVHAADDVHHVAVALDMTVRIHADGAGSRDAAEVVAREIDEHDVLGVLLRIGEQFLLQSRVLRAVLAARPRAGDRPHLRVAVRQLHQRFGRRADDHAVAEIAIEHVRRRIQQAQCAIGFERLQLAFAGEAHRQHQLVDVACGDVLLRAMNAVNELGFAQAADARRVADTFVAVGNRAAQRLHDLRAQRAALALAPRMQQRDAAREVVEYQQRLRCEVVSLRRGFDDARVRRQPLEVAHEIVTGNADQAAGQWHTGNSRARLRRIRERLAQCLQQFVLVARRGTRAAVDREAELVEPNLGAFAEADERIAREALAALDALQQEARLERFELEIRRHRRVQVGSNVEWRFQAAPPRATSLREVRAGGDKKPISGFALGDGFLDSSITSGAIRQALSFYGRRHHHWPEITHFDDMAASITGAPPASQ